MSKHTINIVLFGIGNVGSILLKQVSESQDFFLSQHNIELRFPVITNSTLAFFEKDGLKNNWEANFAQSAIPFKIEDIIEYVHSLNLENLIAVDATASEELVRNYIPLIQNGFHIVAANKKANTLHTNFYKDLRWNLKKYDKSFLYGTNVGAGLPIIQTINDLYNSGEEITKIRGVFSGSLSYIFNRFASEDIPFSEILKSAEKSGLTEPDSREDLSGTDVARKLVILARETGLEAELSNVKITSLLLPETSESLLKVQYDGNKTVFDKPFETAKKAQQQNHVLRYIGELDIQNKTLEAKLISEPSNSPIGRLKGADNIFEIYTKSYGENPIVIQGAGAGREVTARGVLSDILKIAQKTKVRETAIL